MKGQWWDFQNEGKNTLISKRLLLKEFPRYHSPIHLHSCPQPPSHPSHTQYPAHTGQERQDLGHFEDVNFSKEAEIAVAAEYSGLCVCVCVHSHAHTPACVSSPFLTALIPALNLRLIIISSSHYLTTYSYQHRQDSQCQHCLLSFQSKTHSILHYHTFRADVPKKG